MNLNLTRLSQAPNQYGNYCYAIGNPVENFNGINGIVTTANGICLYSNVKLGSLGKEFVVEAKVAKNAKGTFLNLPNAQAETLGDMKHLLTQAKFIGIDDAVKPLMAVELMKLLKVKTPAVAIEPVQQEPEKVEDTNVTPEAHVTPEAEVVSPETEVK